MVSAVDTDVGLVEHTAVAAAPAQKGTTRGADAITESPGQRSAAVTEPPAPVPPQKNDQTQGNQKQMKGSNIIKNWLTAMGDKSRDKTVKYLEQVDSLAMKPKLMNKATAAANKAAKATHKETMNLDPATKTKAASRKHTISFADQQKENLEAQGSALLDHCFQIQRKQDYQSSSGDGIRTNPQVPNGDSRWG